jgi:hypothetical protein
MLDLLHALEVLCYSINWLFLIIPQPNSTEKFFRIMTRHSLLNLL